MVPIFSASCWFNGMALQATQANLQFHAVGVVWTTRCFEDVERHPALLNLWKAGGIDARKHAIDPGNVAGWWFG